MIYKCKTIPAKSLIYSHQGFINPLCETCVTIDCENPIEKTLISVLGINKEVRTFSKGDSHNFVIACEGHSVK